MPAVPITAGARGLGVALALTFASCGGATSDGSSGDAVTTSGPPPVSTSGAIDGGMTASTMEDTVPLDEGGSDTCSCCNFGLCDPDIDIGLANFGCDLSAQECPTDTKCMPTAERGDTWDTTRCMPLAADPVPVGAACTVQGSAVSGIDDCDVGLMCWNVDEDGVGRCEDFCTGSPEAPICEDPLDVCLLASDGAIPLCVSGCDPVVQDCAEGEGCWPAGVEWACQGEASQPGSMPADACTSSTECAPGLVCLVGSPLSDCASAGGCCTPVCDAGSPDGDAACTQVDAAATCQPWYAESEAPIGLDHVGVCLAEDAPGTTGG